RRHGSRIRRDGGLRALGGLGPASECLERRGGGTQRSHRAPQRGHRGAARGGGGVGGDRRRIPRGGQRGRAVISSTWRLRFVVSPMDTSFRALAAAALLLVSCTTSLSQDDRPCPCVSGWTCCAGSNLCAREARICPAVVDTEAPPAPVLAGSVPAPPTNQTQVEVFGDAEAGARVDLFTNDACGGPVAASGAADALGPVRYIPHPRARRSRHRQRLRRARVRQGRERFRLRCRDAPFPAR